MSTENATGSIRFNDCQLLGNKLVHSDSIGKVQEMEVSIIGNIMDIRLTGTVASNVTFDLEEPQSLNDLVAKKMGYNKVTIDPGSYMLQSGDKGPILKMEVETE